MVMGRMKGNTMEG